MTGGNVPTVDSVLAKETFLRIHEAIQNRWIRSCHDLCEGGLAVAAAEMAMAGGLGMKLNISNVVPAELNNTQFLFSESNTRFLVETDPVNAGEFEGLLNSTGVPVCRLGTIREGNELVVTAADGLVIQVDLDDVKAAWKKPLNWS